MSNNALGVLVLLLWTTQDNNAWRWTGFIKLYRYILRHVHTCGKSMWASIWLSLDQFSMRGQQHEQQKIGIGMSTDDKLVLVQKWLSIQNVHKFHQMHTCKRAGHQINFQFTVQAQENGRPCSNFIFQILAGSPATCLNINSCIWHGESNPLYCICHSPCHPQMWTGHHTDGKRCPKIS